MALAQHVHAAHTELANAILTTLWDLFEGWGLAERGANQAAEPHAAESHCTDQSMSPAGTCCLTVWHTTPCLLASMHWGDSRCMLSVFFCATTASV